MKKYIITVEYLGGKKEFLANRVGNNLYYDYESVIGCSVIDIRNKRLINYKKYIADQRRWSSCEPHKLEITGSNPVSATNHRINYPMTVRFETDD